MDRKYNYFVNELIFTKKPKTKSLKKSLSKFPDCCFKQIRCQSWQESHTDVCRVARARRTWRWAGRQETNATCSRLPGNQLPFRASVSSSVQWETRLAGHPAPQPFIWVSLSSFLLCLWRLNLKWLGKTAEKQNIHLSEKLVRGVWSSACAFIDLFIFC